MSRSDRRKYAIAQFMKGDSMIHRVVVESVHGLMDCLMVERKRVPVLVIRDAERLESMIFSGYDCYFEGDEPSGL